MGAPKIPAAELHRRYRLSLKKGYTYDRWCYVKHWQYIWSKCIALKANGRPDPDASIGRYRDGMVTIDYDTIATHKDIDDIERLTNMSIEMRKNLLRFLNNYYKDSIVVVDNKWTRKCDGTGFHIEIYLNTKIIPTDEFMHNLEDIMNDWEEILKK